MYTVPHVTGVDTLLFDLAVCVNDWCLADDSGRIDDARAAALLGAYGEGRALSATEHRLFPAMLRAAALRFWLSRLADRHLPREAALLQPKDPRHFERLLRERVAQLVREIETQIAELLVLAAVEIFRDTAGERHRIDGNTRKLSRPRLGDQ